MGGRGGVRVRGSVATEDCGKVVTFEASGQVRHAGILSHFLQKIPTHHWPVIIIFIPSVSFVYTPAAPGLPEGKKLLGIIPIFSMITGRGTMQIKCS